MQAFANRPRVVPTIPARVLTRHKVSEPTDTRFRAAARLMQSLWRERQGLGCGRRNAKTKFGSRLTDKDAIAGKNFISDDVFALVHRELAYREIGSLIDTKRLFGNLLSSQALTFNMLGPLKRDLTLAAEVFSSLFPDIATVADVYFEHSPGRGERAFTGDHTAFDAAVIYTTSAGRRGFVAIEIKYTEASSSPARSRQDRCGELAQASGLYRDAASDRLRSAALQQFWREHLLAYAMIENRLYDEGRFIVIAPEENRECARQVQAYQRELTRTNLGSVPFEALSMQTMLSAIVGAGAVVLGNYLQDRYLNLAPVDRALITVVPETKRAAATQAAA